MSNTLTRATNERYCIRCSEPVTTKRAYLCDECRDERDAREKEKANRYFRARNAATRRLREEFPDRYQELLDQEKAKQRRKRKRTAS